MSSLLKNEVAINKACSVKLEGKDGEKLVAIVAYVYHTKDKSDPEDKSFYRTEVRVEKVADFEAEVAEMKKPENRTKKWKWTNPTWPEEWFMGYDKSNDQAKGAAWLKSKLKKAMSWEQYVALISEGVKTLGNGVKKQYAGAQYESDGFEDADGLQGLSILDKDVLIAHCGKAMWKMAVMKRDLKAQKAA